jgi:hypothetical protein
MVFNDPRWGNNVIRGKQIGGKIGIIVTPWSS